MGNPIDLGGATILQVIPALEIGGAERTTVEIAAAIVDAGGRAVVASSGGRLGKNIEAAGARLVEMPVQAKNPIVMARNVTRLAALIADERVDIVHVRSRAPAWSALLAARRTQTAMVTTHHGAYRPGGPLKRFYNSVMWRGDVVIANSEFTADRLRAAMGGRGAAVETIPRGADLEAFAPNKVTGERAAALAAQWGGLDDDAGLRLLLPGRFTAWKGQDIAIDAIAQLVAQNSSVSTAHGAGDASGGKKLTLILAGASQGRDEFLGMITRKIERSSLGDRVRIVGHCDDMPAAYSLCDIVLSTSTRPEAFGRVCVEAGAMEKPVIATGHGGPAETIVDGVTGVLTPPGDVAALSAAIGRLTALGPEGRQKMGEAARARVEARYSTSAMCTATLAVYTRILRERGC